MRDIRLYRELEKGEYLLRLNGHSMEPSIPDGSIVIMKKYTILPIPKPGTIVQYHDERGVTLKNWSSRKTRKPAKWNTPSIPLTLPSETSKRWTAAKSPLYMWKPWIGGRRLRNTPSSREAYVSFTPATQTLSAMTSSPCLKKW